MKVLAFCFTLIIGLSFIAWGSVSFFIAYPYSDSPNSGPANTRELLIMASYEGRTWMLSVGVIFMAIAILALRRRH